MWETWVQFPGLGRSPGEGKGYPLQYSGLETSMDCIMGGKVSDTTEWLSLLVQCFTGFQEYLPASKYSLPHSLRSLFPSAILYTLNFLKFKQPKQTWFHKQSQLKCNPFRKMDNHINFYIGSLYLSSWVWIKDIMEGRWLTSYFYLGRPKRSLDRVYQQLGRGKDLDLQRRIWRY